MVILKFITKYDVLLNQLKVFFINYFFSLYSLAFRNGKCLFCVLYMFLDGLIWKDFEYIFNRYHFVIHLKTVRPIKKIELNVICSCDLFIFKFAFSFPSYSSLNSSRLRQNRSILCNSSPEQIPCKYKANKGKTCLYCFDFVHLNFHEKVVLGNKLLFRKTLTSKGLERNVPKLI